MGTIYSYYFNYSTKFLSLLKNIVFNIYLSVNLYIEIQL